MTDDNPTEPIDPAHDPAHLGLEVISDLDEGLLSEDEADRAREHLAGCELCRADREALASVRESLAGDAAEIVMPDDVAARIHAALADEPAHVPEAAAAVTTLPTPREPSRWEARRKPALIGLGAAAVIVALIFGVIHLPRSTSSTAASAGATSAAAPATPVVVLHSGRNYTTANLNAAIGLLASPSPAESGQAASAGAPATAAGATSAAAAASAAAPVTSAAARPPPRQHRPPPRQQKPTAARTRARKPQSRPLPPTCWLPCASRGQLRPAFSHCCRPRRHRC